MLKKILLTLVILGFLVTGVFAQEYDAEGNIIPGEESISEDYDADGNLKPKLATKAMFYFPDVGVGGAYDIVSNRFVNTLNIEILDTDDSPNIIPLRIAKLPELVDIVADVGFGDGIVLMGAGVRFLPILEPGILLWGGYNFNEGREAYGVAIRFGIKF